MPNQDLSWSGWYFYFENDYADFLQFRKIISPLLNKISGSKFQIMMYKCITKKTYKITSSHQKFKLK